jgi:hypothetical protein
MARCHGLVPHARKSTIPCSGTGGPYPPGFNGKQFRIRKKILASWLGQLRGHRFARFCAALKAESSQQNVLYKAAVRPHNIALK